jgi:hypothetical protein
MPWERRHSLDCGAAQAMAAQRLGSATAFVTTNSVCQGLVCSIMWPKLISMGIEIEFAHLPFRWSNKAKGVAQVHVIIVAFSVSPKRPKLLFSYEEKDGDPIPKSVVNISPYLLDTGNYTVGRKTSSQFGLPDCVFGNMPDPAPLLVISQDEAKALIANDPRIKKYLMPAWGAKELLSNSPRVAFWLEGISPSDQKSIPILDNLVSSVRASRLAGSRPKLEPLGGRFAQISQDTTKPMLLIPIHFVEKMAYIPMVFLPAGNTSLNSALAIPGGEKWLFGILSSSLHYLWMDVVGGKIKSDYRYSQQLVYNNFPVPHLDFQTKEKLQALSEKILSTRLQYSDSKLSDMYDRNSMPNNLKQDHIQLDNFVLKLFGLDRESSDAERIEKLLRLSEDAS